MQPSSDRDTLARMRELAARAPLGGDLTPFELKVFSQNGEDGVICELLRRVGAEARSFVEIGAGTGAEANCVYLADVCGFGGLFAEADPGQFEQLEAKYAHSPGVRTVCELVTPSNAGEIAGGEDPDVLSIDIDGADYWVWEAIEARPRIVVIEYNASLPPGRKLVQPLEAGLDAWDGTDYVGASIDALRALADRKGYVLAHTDLTGANAFFVRGDLAQAAALPERVPIRGPSYFFAGLRLPADPERRPYVDLDAPGEDWRPPGEPERRRPWRRG